MATAATSSPTTVPWSASASAISAALRRCGLNPVSTRNREGLRCSLSGFAPNARVHVIADVDRAVDAERLSAEAADVLAAARYIIERSCSEAFYVVSREAPADEVEA